MRHSLLVRLSIMFAVIGLMATLASPVSAGKSEKGPVHEAFDEELCGIPVHTTVDGFFIYHVQDYVIRAEDPAVQDDFWIGVTQSHFNVSYANAAGVTMFQMERNTTQEDPLVNNGDGTWTYAYTVNGQPIRLKSGNQTVLVDVGRISYSFVFHLGDLSTRADNVFISEEITSVIGPHPVAESDFALFCEVVTDILG